MKTIKKIKKLYNNPSVFLRDYLIKKHPLSLNELGLSERDEKIIIDSENDIENIFDPKEPIDIVYTWVDGSDLAWREKQSIENGRNDKELGLNALDPARFENNNELLFSLKSIKKHIPWVRKIFIVTDNQKPSISSSLNQNNIKIIDHTEIIPKKYLPTFNSHVIEAHLHLIPELSENFIYFNDDVFVARDLRRSHFFDIINRPSLFLSQKSLNMMKKRSFKTPTLNASLNSAKLISSTHKVDVDRPLIHTYIPLRKSYFYKAWILYEKNISAFLPNKFRSNNDLNIATFLVPWLTYLEGNAIFRRDICYYFNVRSRAAIRYYDALLKNKGTQFLPHSFCANDFRTSKKDMEDYQLKMNETLNIFFN